MMESPSLADIAAVTEGRNDGFMGGGFWIFALIILFAMLRGGMWGDGNGVSEADLCNANSFNELKGTVGRLSDQLDGVNINLTKGICDLGYTTLENFNALERQLADCCCTTQRGIDSVKFDLANYVAGINANTTAGIQKILDRMCDNEKAQMAARIQQLELQQAMCGVVRYPTGYTYNAGSNPFCGSGCGCNANCI